MSHRVRPGASPYDVGAARHCWVADAVDGLGVERPGLLLEWRQGPTGWQGRVVYAAQPRPGRWVSVEEWVDATLLTPL
jgi:hypothetical protein